MDCIAVAKLVPYRRLGFLTLHSVADELLDPFVNVEAEFGVNLLFDRRGTVAKAPPSGSRLQGNRSAGISSTIPTARVWLRHRSISSSSATAPEGLKS